MVIEVLYFDGCPNHDITISRVEQLVRAAGVHAEVRRVRVGSDEEARSLRFLGSPSVRINGRDLEPAMEKTPEYAMRCRRYLTETGFSGAPSEELVVAAIRRAAEENE